MKINILLGFCLSTVFSIGCTESGTKVFEPIVLGDSTSIVTESNPQFLKNDIQDIEPSKSNPATSVKADSSKPANVIPVAKSDSNLASNNNTSTSTSTNDFVIDIGEKAQLVFAGIKTKSFKEQHPETANSATYKRISGKLDQMKVSLVNGKIKSVKQRYNTIVQGNFKNANIELGALGSHTTPWSSQTVNGNSFTVNGIGQLEFKSVGKQQIQQAIEKALKAKRFKAAIVNQTIKEAKSISSVKQAPLKVTLQYVVWQITGTYANGKSFTKEIRIDN